jgi:hypothetical protein
VETPSAGATPNTRHFGNITKRETSLSNSQLRSTDKGDARFVIGCAHREVNNRNPAIDTSKRREPSDQLLHLFEQGQIFETEVFARRQHRTLGVSELNEIMLSAQRDAYGDGIDQSTAHPHMWVLKPHYYGSHFYNWPYTYGLLFGLGLYARFQHDPEHFRSGYDDVLSRAGMDTAEQLGAAFGLDVTDEAFWTASLDVLRARMTDFNTLAQKHL